MHRYKAVIVGDSQAGKTNLRHRLTQHRFTPAMRTTPEYEQAEVRIEFKGKMACIDLWDTAGQEKHRSLTPIFYRDAYLCVIVYDITNRRSFENASWWFDDFMKNNSPASTLLQPGNKPNVILVGTKSDDEHLREVTSSEGVALAAKWADTVLFCEQTAVNSQELSRLMLAFAVAVERINGGTSIAPSNTVAAMVPSPSVVVTTAPNAEPVAPQITPRPRRLSRAFQVENKVVRLDRPQFRHAIENRSGLERNQGGGSSSSSSYSSSSSSPKDTCCA